LAATELADLPFEEKERMVHEACKAAFAHDFIQQLPEVDERPIPGSREGAS
jgi:ATP-binding cassette subfamily B (MDR/TAP) protein 1